ncbi:glucitol operon GutQ protein [Klebsiella variicola]|nr:glucitol operon GutQ protein [Klebsiella variicola]
MSNFLLEAGRQTLMLELQEASRLPETPGRRLHPRGGNHHPLRGQN